MEQTVPNVLLVDDVEANLVGLEAVLDGLPCKPVRARSGNEALRTLLKSEFALILLDVQMPQMDGFEVAEHLRSNPRTKDTPIIFLTAMHQAEASMLRGYGSGAVDYLVKPFRSDVLRSKVSVFLELYTQKRSLAAALEEQRRTSQELARANDALRHFTQAASHDLRAPLRTVEAFLGEVLEEHGDTLTEDARHSIERSRNAARRMSTLLHSLLVYSSLRKPAEDRAFSSADVVRRVWSDLTDAMPGTDAYIELGELPFVRGDSSRIYQLFLNLIGNALKFRRKEERSRVQVGASSAGPRLAEFTVSDNGIGMAPQYLDSIFAAFNRLHSADQYEGSGLGLTIAREVVEQHRGRLWVESIEGHGSTFHFTLPTAEQPRPSSEVPAP